MIDRAFSPSAPVNRRDLFAGRIEQLRSLLTVSGSRGQHAVVHGERGVGKTSLATVAAQVMGKAIRINCDSSDDFASIWRKVLGEASLMLQVPGVGFESTPKDVVLKASQMLGEHVSPSSVRAALMAATVQEHLTVFLDEYDRVRNPRVRPLMADTIKGLSDHSVDVTVVMVGVADTIDELLAEHESIGRSVVQVEMPRMKPMELHEIIDRGLQIVKMTIDPTARRRIAVLSQGFPHYTHHLAQASAHSANYEDSDHIGIAHLQHAIQIVTEKSEQRLRDLYEKATHSQRKDALYRHVLLACAMADKGDLGFFAGSDVREPLRKVTGKLYQQGTYGQHLAALCEEGRGPVLQVRGEKYRKRYRFSEPPLQPFVILRGLQDDLIGYPDLAGSMWSDDS